MKKNFLILCSLLFIIVFLLTHPALTVKAAADGLLIWYKNVLPALLPMAVLSNIMIYSNYMQLAVKYLYPVSRHILPTSRDGSFAFIGGLLFGFPMGSKISSDLVREGNITPSEAEFLTIVTNQLSPVFISGFVMTGILDMPTMIIPSYLILYLPPILYGRRKLKKLHSHSPEQKKASRSQINFKIIDAGIMNGFEALIKLGCYIMMFSIFAAMINEMNQSHKSMNLLLTGITEVTNGIAALKGLHTNPRLQYTLAIFFLSFGGLCGFAQTCSMTKGCHISMKRYFICKSLFALICGAAAWIFFGVCI